MNDRLRTLAMNSLFMINAIMLIELCFDSWIEFRKKKKFRLLAYRLNKNIVDTRDFFNKMRHLPSLGQNMKQFIWRCIP